MSVCACVRVIEVVAHGAYDKCKPHQICSANDIGAELKTKQQRKEKPHSQWEICKWQTGMKYLINNLKDILICTLNKCLCLCIIIIISAPYKHLQQTRLPL